jgi:hypothetical protein
MSTISIPRKEWQDFLQRFSEQHSGRLIELEIHDRKTEESVTSPVVSLRSIELDLEDERNPRINVVVFDENKEIKHILFRPSQVRLRISEKNGEDALDIESVNTQSTVRLRGARMSHLRDKAA